MVVMLCDLMWHHCDYVMITKLCYMFISNVAMSSSRDNFLYASTFPGMLMSTLADTFDWSVWQTLDNKCFKVWHRKRAPLWRRVLVWSVTPTNVVECHRQNPHIIRTIIACDKGRCTTTSSCTCTWIANITDSPHAGSGHQRESSWK